MNELNSNTKCTTYEIGKVKLILPFLFYKWAEILSSYFMKFLIVL